MKWTEAIDLTPDQFRFITAKELKQRLNVLTGVANKRLARLKEADLTTPASRYLKFSVKNKSYNELKKEFSRARNFLRMKSSTVKGARSIEKAFKDRLKIEVKAGDVIETFDKKEFWEAYNKIKSSDKALITRLSSEQVQSDIYNMMIQGMDVQDIVSSILGAENYESNVEEEVDLFEILEDDF